MPHRVRLRGTGRVEVAAYGLADAEHLVEKEIGRAWPEARVEIRDVTRTGVGRIAEELSVLYRVEAVMEVEAGTREAATREALREARRRLEGTRYARIAWEASRVG